MINGILNIYKEKGYTSHDVVAVLRKVAGQKKIGHTGTLDPDATGVLPVCLGRATKLCDLLTDHDKTYEAVLLLGQVTDTQDTSGTVLETHETEQLDEKQVRECILSFIGEYDQVPPMYSALKVNGKKLYELAREGKTVERKSRRVQIYNISIKHLELPRVTIEVMCSKGTYIRTLCHDIGDKLGVGGCMEQLTRTRVGKFVLSDSVKLEEVKKQAEEGKLKDLILPLDEMFSHLKAVVPADKYCPMVYNGNDFSMKCLQEPVSCEPEEEVRVYDSGRNFIGIYKYKAEQDGFHIVKMFYDPESAV